MSDESEPIPEVEKAKRPLPCHIFSPSSAAAGAGLLATVIALGSLYFVWRSSEYMRIQTTTLESQTILLKTQTDRLIEQTEQVEVQSNLAESSRRSALNFELSAIFDRIDEWQVEHETKNAIQRGERLPFPPRIHARLVAVSKFFKPHRYCMEMEDGGTTLTRRALSPERGQLMLHLVGLSETAGTTRTLLACDLKFADLPGADLWRAQLGGGIHLMGADLSGADLSEANLIAADLRGADLSDAMLYRANLYGAGLSEADLRGADFSFARLSEAKLSGADLSGAFLWRGNLCGAILIGADLSGANLKDAVLDGVALDENEESQPIRLCADEAKAEILKRFPDVKF